MEVTDVNLHAMFRVNITEYNTRDHYFALLSKAVAMEPDRIALSMTHGFLVPATDLGSVLIRFVRTWRTMHDGVDFYSNPPLRFTIEPMFANTGRVEVVIGESPQQMIDDQLLKLIRTLCNIEFPKQQKP
jgi:hypothetical protein